MNPYSLSKDKIKFLLLEGVSSAAVEHLNSAGYSNVKTLKHSLSENQLLEAVRNIHFLGIRSRTQVTEKVLKHAPKLVAIGCFGIGTNQVDLNTAARQGIAVFNAPFSNTRSVAELVIGEAILLHRRVPEKNANAHRGLWQKTAVGAREIRGKTMGIIGYGNIGSQVGILAESIGMNVIYYDVQSKLPISNARSVPSLDSLLASADVVSLHVPANDTTKNMIGLKQFSLMRKEAVLLNASRGNVVDLEVLAEKLLSHELKGAAIDVFPEEPLSNEHRFQSPLIQCDNAFLTPHIGGSTEEAQVNIGFEVADKLIQYSDIGNTQASVNFPEVSLPKNDNAHRILHIHQNIPGVLANINQIITELKINVQGMYLQTNQEIGYVVVDVDRAPGQELIQNLGQIRGTLKCRVLF